MGAGLAVGLAGMTVAVVGDGVVAAYWCVRFLWGVDSRFRGNDGGERE